MSALSSKLRKGTGCFLHWCPGCDMPHAVWLDHPDYPRWQWDGNVERPTVSPSVRHSTPAYQDEDDPEFKIAATCCHYFIRGGRIEFCGDSTHAFAGQTVDLPDWPQQ